MKTRLGCSLEEPPGAHLEFARPVQHPRRHAVACFPTRFLSQYVGDPVQFRPQPPLFLLAFSQYFGLLPSCGTMEQSGFSRFAAQETVRGHEILSLDEDTAETRFASEAFVEQPPDSLYDRGLAATLLERALSSLRSEFEHSGKLDLFERLRLFVWGEKSAMSYAEMRVAEADQTDSGFQGICLMPSFIKFQSGSSSC